MVKHESISLEEAVKTKDKLLSRKGNQSVVI